MFNDRCITLTGMKYYCGTSIFEIGMLIKFRKDKNNQYDSDAICATLPGYVKVGYIANTPYTKAKGTHSAGRIYDSVKNTFYARVLFITNNMVICRIVDENKKRLKRNFLKQTKPIIRISMNREPIL
ncbi:MAG: HIRAN domain-containing protein [Clostridiaceae bacterium]